MGLKYVIREEFRIKKFGFADVHPGRFYMWQWRVPPIVFLLYRFLTALYVDFWVIYLDSRQASASSKDVHVSWAAFLTNWTYIVLAIYLTCSFVVTCIHYFFLRRHETCFLQRTPLSIHQKLFPETFMEPSGSDSEQYDPVLDVDNETEDSHNKLPWYLKIVWILFNVVSSCSLMVTVVVYTLLNAQALTNQDIQLHVLNSVIMIFEHLLCGVPVRILHVIYPLIYGLIYMFFSLFYWIPDHDRVMYPDVLDWNNPGHTVGMVVLVGFVVIPVLHILLFILYRVKLAIYKQCG